MRLLIVGNSNDSHIGFHFRDAAEVNGWEWQLFDTRPAYGNGILQKILWRCDRRPQRQKRFEHDLEIAVEKWSPDCIVITGVAPIRAALIRKVRQRSIKIINFLTDDPWNRAHFARWFLSSLSEYNSVFSPRRSNIQDLSQIQKQVSYQTFGYNPKVHFAEPPMDQSCDVLFVGGADNDRVPYIRALVESGMRVWTLGGYWDRYRIPGLEVKGIAKTDDVRRMTASAKINLILVRRANRDGHVMRSIESVACGGFSIVEDTFEHREIFGESVPFFKNVDELANKARYYINKSDIRERLRKDAYSRIVESGNFAYSRVLKQMVDQVTK